MSNTSAPTSPRGRRRASDPDAPPVAASVYAYGCSAPTEGLAAALDEIARQRTMWDALVRSDRAADRALWEAARENPEIDATVAEIDRLSDEIATAVKARRAARAKVRAKVDTPELDALIADLAGRRKQARASLWPLLATWRKGHKERVGAIEAARLNEATAIRQGSGLYWGNYNRVMDSYKIGRQLARKRGGSTHYSDQTRTDGVLTVQIQRTGSGLGASMAELLAGAVNALRIDPVDPRAFDPAMPRGDRAWLARTWVTMRVDAAGNSIRLPLHLHRLPPDGYRVKQAQLTWHQEGERTRWQLALTVTGPRPDVAHPSPVACGIDVGWRLEPDGSLLVATLWDHTDQPTRYRLPADWMRGMDQVERLESHIDEITLTLARDRHESVADLPDDLRMPLMGWRARLGASHVNTDALHAAIAARIAAVKGTADRADVPEDLRAWYDRYRHLALWRDDLRAKLHRQRREHYRLFARHIAAAYAIIGVEDLDLAGMAKTKKREPETGDNPLVQAARAQRQRAACSLLLAEIGHQASKHGAEIVTVQGATTAWCRACDRKTGQRDRAQRIWTCEHCGTVFDQDIHAAQNIYDVATASPPVLDEAA